jgi:hypothetical protein
LFSRVLGSSHADQPERLLQPLVGWLMARTERQDLTRAAASIEGAAASA